MPMTIDQHRASLHQPAFSELLPVRDILHDVIIRTTGALVAGYELSGWPFPRSELEGGTFASREKSRLEKNNVFRWPIFLCHH
jgi:hypothetical protein